MFNVRTHDTGCSFRSKREQFSITIRKGVHLLFHDIRARSNASRKQLGELENGHTDFMEAIQAGETTRGNLDGLPAANFIRLNVFDAFDTANHGSLQETEKAPPTAFSGRVQRLRLRLFLPYGLAGWPFESPEK